MKQLVIVQHNRIIKNIAYVEYETNEFGDKLVIVKLKNGGYHKLSSALVIDSDGFISYNTGDVISFNQVPEKLTIATVNVEGEYMRFLSTKEPMDYTDFIVGRR